MPTDEEKQRAKERVRAGTALITHLSMYVVVNVGMLLAWTLTGGGYPWFIWMTVFWGVGIVAHAITFFIGPGSANEQRAIERELHRMQH